MCHTSAGVRSAKCHVLHICCCEVSQVSCVTHLLVSGQPSVMCYTSAGVRSAKCHVLHMQHDWPSGPVEKMMCLCLSCVSIENGVPLFDLCFWRK